MKERRSRKEATVNKALKYEGLELPENLSYILEQDFWMLDNIGGAMLSMLREPMKFTAFTSIYVRQGRCKAEINLQQFDIKAPCVVNIGPSEILQPLSISDDFEGGFVVVSQRFINDFKREVADPTLVNLLKQSPVVNLSADNATEFELFYGQMRNMISNPSDAYIYKSVLHTVLAFFYHTALRCINRHPETGSTASHITNRFLKLARDNFKKERFMDFYARELGITSKHLGRTIKSQTGFTASEWLDRMVILEAKVLLKSSSMTIQQIAEELNFPSQSFFGKYFKNIVGVSPKEFRNAR